MNRATFNVNSINGRLAVPVLNRKPLLNTGYDFVPTPLPVIDGLNDIPMQNQSIRPPPLSARWD
jgi:hypothetical protein